jgi:hypothetical protein
VAYVGCFLLLPTFRRSVHSLPASVFPLPTYEELHGRYTGPCAISRMFSQRQIVPYRVTKRVEQKCGSISTFSPGRRFAATAELVIRASAHKLQSQSITHLLSPYHHHLPSQNAYPRVLDPQHRRQDAHPWARYVFLSLHSIAFHM